MQHDEHNNLVTQTVCYELFSKNWRSENSSYFLSVLHVVQISRATVAMSFQTAQSRKSDITEKKGIT